MSDDDAFDAQLAARLERVNERAMALRRHAAAAPRAEVMSLEVMLDRYALWPDRGVVIDLLNPWRMFSVQNFKNANLASTRTIIGPRGGERRVLVANDWLEHEGRIQVEGMAFAPGSPPITRDVNGRPAVNRWQPPHIESLALPEDHEQRAAVFDEHLTYLIPDNEERSNVKRWLAHRVQRPDQLPGWHLLLFAEATQGTGRNWLARLMKQLLKEYVVEGLALHRILNGGFNAELACAVLAIVDEIREGGQDYWKHAEALKSLLTEKTRTINQKFQPVYEVRNCVGVMMFSNHLDALPLDDTDRRIYVARCTTKLQAADYYDSIYAALEDDATLRSLYERLKQIDLSGFAISGRAPMSEAKADVIDFVRSEEETELRRLMVVWPSDVMRSATLRKLIQEVRWPSGSSDPMPKDATLTTAQLRRLYRACGVRGWKQQVTLNGKLFRVVVLRNFYEKWKRAEDAAVSAEVLRGEEAAMAAGLLRPDQVVGREPF